MIHSQTIILLVEDNDAHAALIESFFRRSSLQPVLKRTAGLAQARDILAREAVDLVVADLNLPDGHGSELIRGIEQPRAVPVVIVSSYGDETVAAEVLKQGAIDYVPKTDRHFRELPQIANRALRDWNHLRERNRALEELKASEQRYRILVETMNEGVCIQDPAGRIQYVNGRLCETLGYPRPELLGRQLHTLVNDSCRPLIDRIIRQQLPFRQTFDIELIARDGDTIPTILSPQLYYNEQNEIQGSFAVFTNITRLKQAENQMRSALAEKEILLQEIHHRVKNNLQLIASLLNLQSGYYGDPVLEQIVQECHRRIRVIAMIHEKLYHHADLAQIDIGEHLRSLAEDLYRSFGLTPEAVRLTCRVDAITLPVGKAISCSLMVNEILSNAFEHAFPQPGPNHAVELGVRSREGRVTIEIRDNGIGLPPAPAPGYSSVGMTLIRALARQLQAELTFCCQGGTTCQIAFSCETGNKVQ